MAMIRSFEVSTVRRAASSTLATSYGSGLLEREHVVVRLQAESGLWGWGEASPLPHFTGQNAALAVKALEEVLLPQLIGLDSSAVACAHQRWDRCLPGNTTARAAADMAMYDLFGKERQLAVCKLLGGQFRSQIPITRPLGIQPVDESVRLAQLYAAQGHRTLKLKVGQDAAADIERVRAVRDGVGTGVRLRIDANQGYDLPTAVKVLRALDDVGLEYCEQPLAAADLRGHASLRAHCGVRIALDESVHSVTDAMRIVDAGAADVLVLKLIKCGGLLPAIQIAAVAQAALVGCVVASPYDTQIGAAHALHLAAALPLLAGACELTVFATQPGMATTGHVAQQGVLQVDSAAGCGVHAIIEMAHGQGVTGSAGAVPEIA